MKAGRDLLDSVDVSNSGDMLEASAKLKYEGFKDKIRNLMKGGKGIGIGIPGLPF